MKHCLRRQSHIQSIYRVRHTHWLFLGYTQGQAWVTHCKHRITHGVRLGVYTGDVVLHTGSDLGYALVNRVTYRVRTGTHWGHKVIFGIHFRDRCHPWVYSYSQGTHRIMFGVHIEQTWATHLTQHT